MLKPEPILLPVLISLISLSSEYLRLSCTSQLAPQFFVKVMRMEKKEWTGEVFNLELLFTSSTARLTQTSCLLPTVLAGL